MSYTCAVCHGEFEQRDEWTDLEAEAEMRKRFGEIETAQRLTVCDDCYNALMRAKDN